MADIIDLHTKPEPVACGCGSTYFQLICDPNRKDDQGRNVLFALHCPAEVGGCGEYLIVDERYEHLYGILE